MKQAASKSLRRSGLHIVLMGTDGCGKSTVLPLLKERLAECFNEIIVYHWRPKVLQDAGVASGVRKESTGCVSDPHGQKPHGAAIGLLRLGYYLLDYWLGFFGILKAKSRGDLVIFDRYAPDMWCDPRRYRFGLSQWVLKFACKLVPSPDIGFVLLADAQLLYDRKREVPVESLRKLLVNYQAVADSNRRVYYGIDCSQSPEVVADEIVDKIRQHSQDQLH